jgi:hypothetical protein
MRYLVGIAVAAVLLVAACGTSGGDSNSGSAGNRTSAACPAGAISADNLSLLDADLGQTVTVDGAVASTYYASSSSGSPTFLDFHDPYRGYFKVVIWGQNRGAFPQAPEDYYSSKRLCVTGTLRSYDGPEIFVSSPDQISVAGS